MDDDMTAELANDLRLACQRIARRVRFEGTQAVAPHQFSVLVRVHKQPCTPTALAERDTWMMQHLSGLAPDQLVLLRRAADLLLEVAARD